MCLELLIFTYSMAHHTIGIVVARQNMTLKFDQTQCDKAEQ